MDSVKEQDKLAWKNKVLGVIPARIGSKRLPRKNILPLAGQPLIAYTIKAALSSQTIDRVIVSTDDETIAEIARDYGADVPFLRPLHLATDTASDQQVLQHTVDWLKENEDYKPAIICNLRPTTPFKSTEIIEMVLHKIISTGAQVVRTVTRVGGVYHPYWMYKLSDEGWAETFIDGININEYYQSQLLPAVYRLNGVVDAMQTAVIYDRQYLDGKKMALVVLPEEVSFDIDTELDFKLCNAMMLNRFNEMP